MDNWISIYETDQLYRAELVKDKLQENQIEAVILNQKDSSYIMLGIIRVMVARENQVRAEEIIKTIHCE